MRAEKANAPFDAMPRSCYDAQHPAHAPEAYRVPDGTGGGYWIGDARKATDTESVAPAPAKFLAKSSYQHDISAPREAAGVVRLRAPIRPAGRAPAGTASRYDRDYGKAGSDPRARAPPANGRGLGAGISRRSTTADLASGLVRSTKHVPGYGGFIAGSAYNPAALDHSDGVLTKGSLKDQALLRALDQFHRDRVPGDTLWRPRHPQNVRMDPPTPTRSTSAGAAAPVSASSSGGGSVSHRRVCSTRNAFRVREGKSGLFHAKTALGSTSNRFAISSSFSQPFV